MNNDLFFQIPDDWQSILSPVINEKRMIELENFLKNEIQTLGEHNIYPPKAKWFNALKKTPFDNVKVVILGQDPYHGEGQAHGLAFSVKNKQKQSSLQNIFKAINNDLNHPIPKNCTELTSWAEQGVLLLNTVLTVRKASPKSHQKQGWEEFTDKVIDCINEHNEHVVFMLWGKDAQSKSNLINANKHKVLKSFHPSGLSAYKGFWDCKHFSICNEYLVKHGKTEIDWQIEKQLF